MRETQVSAFLENRPGRLLHLLDVLGQAGINVIAHNIVDASDFGIIHLIVDDPRGALKAIHGAGITCSTTTVLNVAVPDEPGAFANHVLRPLADSKVNIEYSYVSPGAGEHKTPGRTNIILKVSDIERAEEALGIQ